MIMQLYLLWTHVHRVHHCDAELGAQGADVRYRGGREEGKEGGREC